ncbi:hypothetical protein AVEN_239895-1 [Araneus ventricosus]|uniref:Uncharacterized protein n=1 Tax=Araneus ventricosus TaxID=182803 RepID=A0A4Y2R3W8_ARAVE|nr:hypothetical protein AVEN_239895-1 [Araneus ventricosus]
MERLQLAWCGTSDTSRDDPDRDRCVSNLSYHLHLFMSIVYSDEFGQLQQDNMNIIELIWVALQCAVQKRSPPPGTPMDLRTALQDSRCELPPGYLQTLVDTMPRRVASLLCARVDPKQY